MDCSAINPSSQGRKRKANGRYDKWCNLFPFERSPGLWIFPPTIGALRPPSTVASSAPTCYVNCPHLLCYKAWYHAFPAPRTRNSTSLSQSSRHRPSKRLPNNFEIICSLISSFEILIFMDSFLSPLRSISSLKFHLLLSRVSRFTSGNVRCWRNTILSS